jgi:hypothetical protein
MHKVAVMIFSHLPDLEATVRLVSDLMFQNPKGAPIYVTVHPGEQELFKVKLPDVAHVYQDNEIFDSLLVDTKKRLQSVKLNLHRLKLAEHWIALNSNETTDKAIFLESCILEGIERDLLSRSFDTDHYFAANMGTLQDLYREYDNERTRRNNQS